MFNLLLESILLMPRVFLRTVPLGVILGVIYFGLVWAATDPWHKLGLIVVMTTPFIAMMRMCALRAALVAIGRTTAPSFQNLSRAQMRMAYGNLLPINLLQLAAFLLLSYLLADIMVGVEPVVLLEMVRTNSLAPLTETALGVAEFVQISGWVFALVAAIGFGAMGTPMAVTAANAAVQSPRHDITFGFAHRFWSLTLLYGVAMLLNSVVVLVLVLFVLAVFGAGGEEMATYGGLAALVVYISAYFSTTAAGAAISYGQFCDREAAHRAMVQDALGGPTTSADELRAIREQRLGRTH